MEEYYFIVNLKSRTGKAVGIWKQVREELERQGVQYHAYLTKYAGHARELAAALVRERTKRHAGPQGEEGKDSIRLVVMGGDGTINEVIDGIGDLTRVEMGFIPTGSGNDLGRGLGIKGDPVDSLNRILHPEKIMSLDLGEVVLGEKGEKHRFIISSGIGLDANVCKQALDSKLKQALNRIRLGNLTYVLLTIKTLFSMKTVRAEVMTDTKEQLVMEHMICVAVMNLPYEGGGVPMAPDALPTDGRLSFCCIYGIPKWRAFLCLPFLVAGHQEKIKGFQILNCRSMDLRLEHEMIVHGDGEYLGQQDRLHYSCLPGVLKIRM